ncbi:TAXI family TRAP transporter solute-binding subunit [Niveispirillum fermenti]|uniref:TAXI family TRAP transporter solute-binding subunit n=1 Tax=Niveispirillum fermenti TaxID=1233113 RepID=UPI003A84C5D8
MSRKYWLLPLLAVPLLGVLALGRAPAGTEPGMRYLRIAADPSGERGFDVGTALAAMLSRPPGMPACGGDRACGVPGLIALTQSLPGRTDIVDAVAAGAIETGLAPADRIYAARCQPAPGARPADLTILGEIYAEALHVLVRPGLDITDPAALKGRRVAIGVAGSDERRLAERILSAHGLRRQTVRGVETGGAAALQALAEGRIDALFRIAAAPDPAIATVIDAGARLVPVTGEAAGRLSGLHPFGAPDAIEAGIYGADQPAIATMMQPVAWIAGPALDPALAQQLITALASRPNRDLLHRQDPDIVLLRPAAFRMSAPLHPAADSRYGIDPITMACPGQKPR